MNSLSWFLYIADVLSRVPAMFGVIGVIFVLVAVVPFVFGMVSHWDSWSYNRQEYDRPKPTFNYKWAVPGFLMVMISNFFPSQQTIYAIAASQTGQYILELQEVQNLGGGIGGLAQDSIDLLRQQIQEQLTVKSVEGK